MRRDCLTRLLECLKVVRADLLWVVACVHATLQLLSIHVELDVTAGACHALVIGLVALHL